jgi:Crp-like helix-turn-helix domain
MMPDPTDLIAQLQTVEHFRDLSDADIRTIIQAGRVRRFGADETIFAESEPCAGMFVLLDPSDSGQHPIDRCKHPNHQLAARIATVPEAFSRALNGFKQRGYISSIHSEIIVSDPAALASLAA